MDIFDRKEVSHSLRLIGPQIFKFTTLLRVKHKEQRRIGKAIEPA